MQLGYLRYSESLGNYALSTPLLSLAYPMLASLTNRQVVHPLMRALADVVVGQVSMGMTADDERVFIESSRSARHRHTLPGVGASTPMVVSAMGQSLYARSA